MTDDKKKSQGGSSLSSHHHNNVADNKADIKKDALKRNYINRTIRLQQEKRKVKYRQTVSNNEAFTDTHSSSANIYSGSAAQTYGSTQQTDNVSDNINTDNHNHYLNDAKEDNLHKNNNEPNNINAIRAAKLKKMLESGLNDNNRPQQEEEFNDSSELTEHLSSSEDKTSDNDNSFFSEKSLFIGEYKSIPQDIKESYKKSLQVNQYTAQQKKTDMYFQHQENKTIMAAEKAVDSAVTSYAVEGTVRNNATAAFEMLSEAVDNINSGNAAKLIAQPAVHFVKGQLNQKFVHAAEKVCDIGGVISSSDSVSGAVTNLSVYAIADTAKNLAKGILLPSDRKMKNRLEKKVNRINQKALKKQNAIQKARGDAMNGKISSGLEKKLDKIELKQDKYREKLIRENKKLQKQQYAVAMKREKQIGVYKRYNASGKKINRKKKKGGALALAGAGSVVPILLLLLIVMMIISSLFTWITSFDLILAGENDDDKRTVEDEYDIILGYTLMVQNFMDITQAYYYYDYGDWSGGRYSYPEPSIDFDEYFEQIAQQIVDELTEQYKPLFEQVTSAEEGQALGKQLSEAISKALEEAKIQAMETYKQLIYDLDHIMTPIEKRQHWEVEINSNKDNGIKDSLDFTGKPIIGTNKFGNLDITTEFSAEDLVAMTAIYKMLKSFDTTNNENPTPDSDEEGADTEESFELTSQDITDFFYDTDFFNITANISFENSCTGNCTRRMEKSLNDDGKTYTWTWTYFCPGNHLNLTGKIGDCKTKDELIEKIVELTHGEDNGFDKKSTEELYDAYVDEIKKTLDSENEGLHRFGAADKSRANKFYQMLIKETQNNNEEKIPNNYWSIQTPFNYNTGNDESEDKS